MKIHQLEMITHTQSSHPHVDKKQLVLLFQPYINERPKIMKHIRSKLLIKRGKNCHVTSKTTLTSFESGMQTSCSPSK